MFDFKSLKYIHSLKKYMRDEFFRLSYNLIHSWAKQNQRHNQIRETVSDELNYTLLLMQRIKYLITVQWALTK